MRTRRQFGVAVLAVAALALLLGGTGQARAAFFTYTESATASGSLAGTPFTNALVTMTATADTNNVTQSPLGTYQLTVATMTVTVDGFPTATFTDAMEVYVTQPGEFAGTDDTTARQTVLANTNTAFLTYDLTSAISKSGAPFIHSGEAFPTTAGAFVLNSTGTATFTAGPAATAAPEPASLTLLGIGALGLLGYGWRRWRQVA